jgi:DNA-binding transcriptional LysR family regulator
MRFDLTDLRLFVHVCDAGTITRGADRTHMTLAAASERIRDLEDSLGTPLLIRGRRGVDPTPAGRALLRHARLVLQQAECLESELSDYGAGRKGFLRVMCNTSAISEHLPEVLSPFLARHAGLSIHLDERTSTDIVDAVRGDACDIGVVSDAVDLTGLEVFSFRADPLVLIAPRNHPIAIARCGAGAGATCLSEIIDHDHAFVGLGDTSALQAHIAQHARRLGKRLTYRMNVRGFDALCRTVGAGIGLGIVPERVAKRYARSANIKRITLTDAWASRRLVVCVRRMHELPIYARQLVQHVMGAARA